MSHKADVGLTTRSLSIAVLLTLIAGFWVRQSEVLVLATQITESVPAIPGLAALTLILPLSALMKRSRKLKPLSRAEMLIIFAFVTISSTVMGVGVTQFLFALIGTPFYFQDSGIPSIRNLLPQHLLVHNLDIIRHMYEGSPDGRVPWGAWLQPCLLWLLFFVALWCTLYSMMALFYRAWAEDERLLFPQVLIPLEMTGQGETGTTPFFKNRLMWTGFIIAAICNGMNIAHAFIPPFPAIGREIDMASLFQAPPWNEVAPLKFHIRPELIGLGYLVSTEISFTVWVTFLLEKAASIVGVSIGATPGTLPYTSEQGIGAYLVVSVMLIWISRRALKSSWRQALHPGICAGGDSHTISYRTAWIGLITGFVAVWLFMTLAGMAAWTAMVYLVLVLAVALVYGRLRAEAGVPLVWLFPYYMQKKALLYAFGSAPFAAAGPRNMPTWSLFTFLSRGYYPAVSGYQIESMALARRAGIPAARMAMALLLAVILGVLVGWYNHLTPYYQHGAAQLRGGIWGDWFAEPEYSAAAHYSSAPLLPDFQRTIAICSGALIVFAVWSMRLKFTGFLLHPLGYVMTCSYGNLIWSSFLIVWLCKSLALRYGGMQFYRRTIPFFLGLALGHFAVAGIFWGLVGAWSGDAVQGYQVFFG